MGNKLKKLFIQLLFILVANAAMAQSVTISGDVFGFLSEKVLLMRNASKNVSFEGPVSGAKLSLQHHEHTMHVNTDITGTYSFVLSKPGMYKLKIESKDYSSITLNIHYVSAGLKTYYPGLSFILKKGDDYLYPIGELLIDNEGTLIYKMITTKAKKVEDVVLSPIKYYSKKRS